MICLFDTSALVKLIIDEPGSESAVTIWNRSGVPVTSRLAQPELAAALAAARRADRLRAPEVRVATRRASRLFDEVTWLELGPDNARLAAALATDHVLSGADAVHLACAVQLGAESMFATFDERLRLAAGALGISLLPAQTS
ncbi:MAG TPA: type II toxin-antitoxin system VapC family toxin [Candidatus Limnocylindria bacterium]